MGQGRRTSRRGYAAGRRSGGKCLVPDGMPDPLEDINTASLHQLAYRPSVLDDSTQRSGARGTLGAGLPASGELPWPAWWWLGGTFQGTRRAACALTLVDEERYDLRRGQDDALAVHPRQCLPCHHVVQRQRVVSELRAGAAAGLRTRRPYGPQRWLILQGHDHTRESMRHRQAPCTIPRDNPAQGHDRLGKYTATWCIPAGTCFQPRPQPPGPTSGPGVGPADTRSRPYRYQPPSRPARTSGLTDEACTFLLSSTAMAVTPPPPAPPSPAPAPGAKHACGSGHGRPRGRYRYLRHPGKNVTPVRVEHGAIEAVVGWRPCRCVPGHRPSGPCRQRKHPCCRRHAPAPNVPFRASHPGPPTAAANPHTPAAHRHPHARWPSTPGPLPSTHSSRSVSSSCRLAPHAEAPSSAWLECSAWS